MTTPLLKKIGVKQGMRSILIAAPPEAIEAIGLPGDDVAHKLAGSFNYIHFFVTGQEELDATFRKLKSHLRADGMLWVSWPKGGALGTDLTLRKVIEIGYNHGLVESKTISVNPTWSAIKFTFPKEGKQYNNSYGQLGKKSS
jgi:hypothetical protein